MQEDDITDRISTINEEEASEEDGTQYDTAGTGQTSIMGISPAKINP